MTRLRFDRRKAQFERRCKLWGFRKNITKDDWRAIASSIFERRTKGKKSWLYLYDKWIPEKKVEKELARYQCLEDRNGGHHYCFLRHRLILCLPIK